MAVRTSFQSHLPGTIENPASYSQLQSNARSTISSIDLLINLICNYIARAMDLVRTGELDWSLGVRKTYLGAIRLLRA
jgi:hypothetical protein